MPKESSVVVPRRPTVHGTASAISSLTAPQRLVEAEAALVLACHLLDPALHVAAECRLLQ